MARVHDKSKIDVAYDILLAWQGIFNLITVKTSKARGNIGRLGPATSNSAMSNPTSTILHPARGPSYSPALQSE